jgi:hypothetical protein
VGVFFQGITEKNDGVYKKKKKRELSFSVAISNMKKILEFIFIIAKESFFYLYDIYSQ